MPSNYTQNYQLSQWEATDPVLHTDFNTDNAKIEAALDSKVAKVVLHNITVSEPTAQFDFDMIAEDWCKYAVIYIVITPETSVGNPLTIQLGSTATKSHHKEVTPNMGDMKNGLLYWGAITPSTTLIFPGGSDKNNVHSVSFMEGRLFSGYGSDFRNVKTLSIISSEIPVGTRIRVTGLL